MKWSDKAIALRLVPFSENKLRLTVLTYENGCQTGLLTLSKRESAVQIGDYLTVTWNARLSEHLGRFQIERLNSPAPRLFDDSWRLWLLQNACGLMAALPDRHPYAVLYDALYTFTQNLAIYCAEQGFAQMTLLEKLILAELGFGIDLLVCCVTGQNHDLIYLSPKSGRAVSKTAGEPYKEKLFALPSFWLDLTDGPEDGMNKERYVHVFLNPDTSLCNPRARPEDLDLRIKSKDDKEEKFAHSAKDEANKANYQNIWTKSVDLNWKDILAAFNITDYFWRKWLLDDKHNFPRVRQSIIKYCEKRAG